MQIQLSKDVLLRKNLTIQDARRQCYDGCSTMTGTKNGVAAQIKKLNEKCLLMQCLSLNLAVGDTIKNIPLLKDTLDMAYEVTKLIKKSSKSEAEFHRKQAELLGQMEREFHVYDVDSPSLKILCPTRWTVRAASQSAILKNYGTLMKLWGWPQDNVSDSDRLQLAIVVLFHSDNLALAFREQSYVQCMLKRMPSFLSLFFEGYNQTGMQASMPPLDQVTQAAVKLELQVLPRHRKTPSKYFEVMLNLSTIPM